VIGEKEPPIRPGKNLKSISDYKRKLPNAPVFERLRRGKAGWVSLCCLQTIRRRTQLFESKKEPPIPSIPCPLPCP
jgi:hypothetical protein